jgi:hypothetical protein
MGYALVTNGKIWTQGNQALLATKDFYDHSAPFVVSVRVDSADGVVNIDSASTVFGSTTYSKVLFLSKTKHAKTEIKDAAHAVELFCKPLTERGISVIVSQTAKVYPASTVMSARQLWKFFRTTGIPRSAIKESKHWVPDGVDAEEFLSTGEKQCADYKRERQASESGAGSSQSSSQSSDWSSSSQSS